jgi:transcription termination factor Rho
MEIIRKIAEPGTIYIDPDQLRWLGDLEIGDYVVQKDDTNKRGQKYIAIFKPEKPEHLAVVEERKKNNNK